MRALGWALFFCGKKGDFIMGTYNVHAGHCPQGKGASGAVGILQESVEDRIVKNEVIRLLRAEGNTVYDCTCDENTTASGCLSKVVAKCNQHSVDLDISIHLNSGRNDYGGDGSTGGVEVWNYDTGTQEISNRICEAIAAELGIHNRRTKYSKSLYVLANTKSRALLIECCFVDDADDAKVWDAKRCAKAIVRGILNENMSTERYMLHTFGKDNKGRVRTKVYDNQQKCYCKSGWYNINGKYYFVGSDEYLLMGWQENVDGRKKVYFIGPDWHLHAGWLSFGSTRYYMSSNGDMATGWKTIKGDKYYFGNDGIMRTKWADIDGKRYWFDASTGKMLKGRITFGSTWYYLSEEDGHLMYTDKEGKLF